ncbi:hypothetical protein [Petrachloros mirabilis]
MDQESLAQIQQIVGAATESLRADIADAKRQSGVLTEQLRHELQHVAEGFQMHLDRRHVDDRSHLDEQFRETRALIQLSYGQIQERVERLEQRVRTIEQHLGLSA